MMAIGHDGLCARRKTRARRAVRGALALILLSAALATGACTLPYEVPAPEAISVPAAAPHYPFEEVLEDLAALIEGGADPFSPAGATPLHMAAANSNHLAITELVEDGADPGARMENGMTPLHAAVFNPRHSVVEVLIEGGADPDARGDYGMTPLHLAAAFNSNPSVIKALIEGGANRAARDYDGKVPFDYARDNEALKGTDAYWLLYEARFE